MKRSLFGIIFLLIATIGLASSGSTKEAKVTYYGCTQTIVTLPCGAQYEGCYSGWLEQYYDYVIMNRRYCDDEIEPPGN